MKTHDYTRRTWGHDYIFRPIDDGMKGDMSGWGYGIEQGDYLLLQNDDASTRYQVDTIDYYANPDDQWRASVTFAPRQQPSK